MNGFNLGTTKRTYSVRNCVQVRIGKGSPRIFLVPPTWVLRGSRWIRVLQRDLDS